MDCSFGRPPMRVLLDTRWDHEVFFIESSLTASNSDCHGYSAVVDQALLLLSFDAGLSHVTLQVTKSIMIACCCVQHDQVVCGLTCGAALT